MTKEEQAQFNELLKRIQALEAERDRRLNPPPPSDPPWRDYSREANNRLADSLFRMPSNVREDMIKGVGDKLCADLMDDARKLGQRR
jgi:hypothetical protein